jgi:polysaccharide biosynthesis protein PslG
MNDDSRSQSRSNGDRASTRTRTNQPCLVIVIALLLVIAGVGMQAWNLFAFSPWTATRNRPAVADAVSYPNSLVNPYGVNTFLSNEVEPWKRERTMEMIAAAGVGWIKQQVLWSDIKPQRVSHWDEKYHQDAWKK